MKKEMLINVLQPEESRIAIVEDGVLEELYVERSSAENYVGNVYKGRVVNIEASIQAAFVDLAWVATDSCMSATSNISTTNTWCRTKPATDDGPPNISTNAVPAINHQFSGSYSAAAKSWFR